MIMMMMNWSSYKKFEMKFNRKQSTVNKKDILNGCPLLLLNVDESLLLAQQAK